MLGGVAGDETPAQVIFKLTASDYTISATNDITVAEAISFGTAQKLELDAGHNVLIKAAMTANFAAGGAAIVLNAGNNVLVDFAITASAPGDRIVLTAGSDVIATAAITASAMGAKIDISGRDVSVVAVTASGGGTVNLHANRDVIVNDAITADNGINGPVILRADDDGTGPGVVGGTVKFVGAGAVVAPNATIRFNPDGYAQYDHGNCKLRRDVATYGGGRESVGVFRWGSTDRTTA